MEIVITHLTATWLIPTVIFVVIGIISWIGIWLSYEMAALPFMMLWMLDCAWFIVYMVVWFVIHWSQFGLIHIKIVG